MLAKECIPIKKIKAIKQKLWEIMHKKGRKIMIYIEMTTGKLILEFLSEVLGRIKFSST